MAKISYRMIYKDVKGASFKWLFIDDEFAEFLCREEWIEDGKGGRWIAL